MTTISIYCVHCHKRYNAPATMAGKKVKCKHCGKVFAIPADAAEPAQDEIPQAGAPAAPSRAVAKPEASAGEGGSKAAATGKLGQANAGYAARIARNENAVEVEFADAAAPIVMLRPSIPHDFPGAAAIDQWLPPLMAMLGLGLLSMMEIGRAHV